MKFLERVLIFMFLIGLGFVVFPGKPDPTLVLTSSFFFAIFYLPCMPLLLADMTWKETFSKQTGCIGIGNIAWGVLFGAVSAYCLFSVAYYFLGKMDRLALIENCGLLLVIISIPTAIALYRTGNQFYKRMLQRCGVIAIAIAVSFVLKMLL